jgi:hypothetical protein
MRKFTTMLTAAYFFSVTAGLVLAQNDKGGRDKKGDDKKSEYPMTPELVAFQKQLESQPTEKIKQLVVSEKAALEQWCKKNNFDPPGNDDRGKSDGKGDRKGRGRGKGKGDRGKVAISKRQEAELLTQYLPWKAKIDLMEQELREREKPKKEDRQKKNK